MTEFAKKSRYILWAALLVPAVGCTSMKIPAAANVAVDEAAVDDALKSGGTAQAGAELQSERDRLAEANAALSARDFGRANIMAAQALADARLANCIV